MTLDLEGMLRRLNLATVRRLYAEVIQRAETEDGSGASWMSKSKWRRGFI